MAILRENPVTLEDISEYTLLSLLHTLGFEIDKSIPDVISNAIYSGWRIETLIDEARRRGYIVEMRISKKS